MDNKMTREQFLHDVSNWSNHRYLLWEAMHETKGLVVEFGCGDGSTKFLREYCTVNNRPFESYENNTEWASLHDSTLIYNWEDMPVKEIDVLLIDHAPGERRYVDIQRFAKAAKIIVIHDSEPAATGYMLNKIWHLFKYRYDFKTDGAWASAVSNHIDVSKWQIS